MISHQGLQQPLYLEVKSDLLVMSKISQVKSLKSGGGGGAKLHENTGNTVSCI